MKKERDTKLKILDAALLYASEYGIEMLTIGKLSEIVGMSKSGLFAHFKSKETMQISMLEYASEVFINTVMVPAIKKPRGIERIRAIAENWRMWDTNSLPGGCPFISASVEFDDRPGKVRDRLQSLQQQWIDTLAHSAKLAVEAGEFKKETDCKLFAFEFNAIMLGYNHYLRMLGDKKAKELHAKALDNLIEKNRQ